jgi:hypothetical protein
MKNIDLTGQRFGRLIAVKYVGKSKWECRCDCGNMVTALSNNLRRGNTTSCGCARQGHAMSHVKNTVGQRFGKLVVLEELTGGKVKCRCDCGNIKTINKAHLLHGDITSCGCDQKEMAKKNREPFLYCGTDINKIKASNATSRSKSGVRGVCWDDRKGKWRANIGFKGQKFDLGYYDNIDDAIAARKAAEEKYYAPLIKEWEGSHDK